MPTTAIDQEFMKHRTKVSEKHVAHDVWARLNRQQNWEFMGPLWP